MGQIIVLKILFAIFSIAVSARDIKTETVPRIIFMAAFPVFFLLINLFAPGFNLITAVAGLFTGLFIFLLVYIVTDKKLGLADVWYSALIGMVLGARLWYMAIGCACAAGIVLILISKRKKIPFIPCMAIGSILIFFTKGQ